MVNDTTLCAVISAVDEDGDGAVEYMEFVHALQDWGHRAEAREREDAAAKHQASAPTVKKKPNAHSEEMFWRLDHQLVSRRAQVKHWNRKYVGTVTGWMSAQDNSGEALWHFKHDNGQHGWDSDSEDLDEGEVEAAVEAFTNEAKSGLK